MILKIIKGEFDPIIAKTGVIENFQCDYNEQDHSVIIKGDLENFRMLIDNLCGLIGSEGVGEDGEINYFGLAIETIIDDIVREAGDDIWE